MAGVFSHPGGAVLVGERRPERLWRRWGIAVTIGEFVGFTIPSVAGGIAWSLDVSRAALYATLVCAGACEGAVLGGAQWIVLRDPLPSLTARCWIAVTAAAAALAWSLGMLPSTLGDRLDPVPALALAPVFAAGGIVLLLSIGGAQSFVLRAHVIRAWRWAGANALAWCAGLLVAVSFMSVLLTEDTTLQAGIAIGVAAGALMGAIVAVVTGWFLRPHPGGPLTMRRWGNPFVRALLRSPLHRLLSGSLLLVTYTGNKSGRTFTIPVMYAGNAEELLVYVGRSRDKIWWRNLRGGAPVRIRLRGHELDGTGSAVSGGTDLRDRDLARFPRAAAALEAETAPIFVRISDLKPSDVVL